jgi:nucleoside-diphosphate-sugar epimerase
MRDEAGHSIVLTGATGFLGAFLMAGLLERGYHVTVLGRSSKDMGLPDRLSGLVRWFGIADRVERLCALEADFSKRHLGLDDAAYGRLCAATVKIIHCASDTGFAERNRARVMATNVNSLPALLDLAADARADHLYYVSTAYAAGMREGICMETPLTTDCFTNVYEESKAQAETIIGRYCENRGMPLSILRPSIVYGHSKMGIALKFNALYYPVKSILYIRDIFVKDIVEQGGERSRRWGVSLGDDGILYLPLAVYLPNRGSVNLIPVDYFVESALSIIEHSGSGGVYHITSDNPPDTTTLFEYAERFLGVRGIRALWDPSGKNPAPNPAEELFDRFIEQYRPYLSDRRIFDRSRMESITPGLSAPPFTYDIFERCMAYAVACDWGKKVGSPNVGGLARTPELALSKGGLPDPTWNGETDRGPWSDRERSSGPDSGSHTSDSPEYLDRRCDPEPLRVQLTPGEHAGAVGYLPFRREPAAGGLRRGGAAVGNHQGQE